jgi:hypothetical protein
MKSPFAAPTMGKGHWATDCRSKPRKKETTHVAETKEEEPSLFLVSATTVQSFTPPAVSVSATTGDDSALMATLALSLPDVAHEDH